MPLIKDYLHITEENINDIEDIGAKTGDIKTKKLFKIENNIKHLD